LDCLLRPIGLLFRHPARKKCKDEERGELSRKTGSQSHRRPDSRTGHNCDPEKVQGDVRRPP
jgi:hypothetical protein